MGGFAFVGADGSSSAAVVDASLVVISQIQNEQIVKVEILVYHFHDLSRNSLKQF